MHSIQVKVRAEVLKNLNNIKIDAQELRNLISIHPNLTEKAISESFTFKHLESNGALELVDSLQTDIKTLKMLLNLLK